MNSGGMEFNKSEISDESSNHYKRNIILSASGFEHAIAVVETHNST